MADLKDTGAFETDLAEGKAVGEASPLHFGHTPGRLGLDSLFRDLLSQTQLRTGADPTIEPFPSVLLRPARRSIVNTGPSVAFKLAGRNDRAHWLA